MKITPVIYAQCVGLMWDGNRALQVCHDPRLKCSLAPCLKVATGGAFSNELEKFVRVWCEDHAEKAIPTDLRCWTPMCANMAWEGTTLRPLALWPGRKQWCYSCRPKDMTPLVKQWREIVGIPEGSLF